MLGLAGIMSIIDGIMALSKSKAGFFNPGAVFVFSDLRTWGWITLIIGVLLILAAGGVMAGSQGARWFGIFAAGLNMLAMFSFQAGPSLWTLTMTAIDIIVIYGLATYGGRRAMA
jgi:hypothetical protein